MVKALQITNFIISAATTSNMINLVPASGISITAIAATVTTGSLLLFILIIVILLCVALFTKRKGKLIIDIKYAFKLILWVYAGARRILDRDNSNENDTVGTEHDYVHNDPIKVYFFLELLAQTFIIMV